MKKLLMESYSILTQIAVRPFTPLNIAPLRNIPHRVEEMVLPPRHLFDYLNRENLNLSIQYS